MCTRLAIFFVEKPNEYLLQKLFDIVAPLMGEVVIVILGEKHMHR